MLQNTHIKVTRLSAEVVQHSVTAWKDAEDGVEHLLFMPESMQQYLRLHLPAL